jgi:hypothetical protein
MPRIKVAPKQIALPTMQTSSPKSLFLVDELVGYETKTTGHAAKHFGHGKESCHLIVAGKLDDLHEFAKRIGLKREWYQGSASWPHYDLTANKRAHALRYGALECGMMQEAKARNAVHRRVKQLRAEGKVDHIKTRDEALDFMSRMLREYFNDDGTLKPEMLTEDEV